MQKRLTDLLRSKYAPPILLALVAALAYGLLLTQTGFYWDDLPMSWIRYQLGPEAMAQYFSTNRPVWGLLYQLTTRIFPQVPIFWQVFALFWRWVGAVLVWALVRRMWPQRERFALSVSLLFLVYPGFNAQWTAYLYSHFFIVLAFFLFSLFCTVKTVRHRSWIWTIFGMLFSALNLWMLEYFFLLELTRVAVIWIAIRDDIFDTPQRIRRVLKLWAPYLAVFAAAVWSRFFVFNNQVYGIGLIPRLKVDYEGAMLDLLQTAGRSLGTVSISAWMQAFQLPNLAVHGPRTIALYMAVLVLVIGAALTLLWPRQAEGRERGGAQARWFVGLGLIMLPFASAPFWLTDLPIALAFPANRATLPSMLAVSFILAGLLELIRWPRLRYVLLAVLVGLAAGRQFLWGTDFSRDWETQKNMFWQMTWRAPALQPNTMVLVNEGALHFYADNSLSAALNWVYAPNLKATGEIPYLLFYPTNRLDGALSALKPGLAVNYDYLAGKFVGNTSQVVSFYFLPPACLRVLDPVIDGDNHFIPDQYLMREGAALSSSAWILPEKTATLPSVYGSEPSHGWCYYFERADLARQLGHWDQVARLGNEAFALDDYPNDPSERFVYIEGYAHVGDWAKAVSYSIQSHRVSPNYVDPMLCKLWQRIDANTTDGAEKTAALSEVRTKFSCTP
jgi:hypothetical protein